MKACRVVDDVLNEETRKRVYDFLLRSDWRWGWKSDPRKDPFSFWHKHYAGWRKAEEEQYPPEDCAHELSGLMLEFWWWINTKILPGSTLSRCYANAFAYGMDGTLHTDSEKPGNLTLVYYPHERWAPNWGGETVFFNQDKTDIIGVVYPRPNRLAIFDGRTLHVARGVSRSCPVLRITLMFKVWNGTSNS